MRFENAVTILTTQNRVSGTNYGRHSISCIWKYVGIDTIAETVSEYIVLLHCESKALEGLLHIVANSQGDKLQDFRAIRETFGHPIADDICWRRYCDWLARHSVASNAETKPDIRQDREGRHRHEASDDEA